MLAEPLSPDEQMVSRIESLLASHEDFGLTDRIWQRASARLRFALEILGERQPAAGRALAALDGDGRLPQLVRDPVVRMVTEAALQGLHQGEPASLAELEQVLTEAAACSAPRDDRMPTQIADGGGLVAGPDRSLWVLGFPADADPLAARLARACTENFIDQAGRTGELNPGTQRTAAFATAAHEVLAGVLPVLGPEIMRHVAAVGTITAQGSDGAMLSAAGGAPVPGIIVIRPSELEKKWDAAARMLHEALHLRLFDISMSSALIADLSSGACVPWRPVRWDLRRIIAAFHVYAHLAVFQAAIRARRDRLTDQFGQPPDNPGVSESDNDDYADPERRLRFLGEQLTGPLERDLTPTGRRLVRWQLAAIAPILDWSPAPAQPAARPVPVQDSPAQGFRPAAGLVIRRDPQAGVLLAYNTERGALHVLNLAVWVAFELCDGRDLGSLRRSYAEIVASKLAPDQAARHLDAALAQLHGLGLIEPASPPSQERR